MEECSKKRKKHIKQIQAYKLAFEFPKVRWILISVKVLELRFFVTLNRVKCNKLHTISRSGECIRKKGLGSLKVELN